MSDDEVLLLDDDPADLALLEQLRRAAAAVDPVPAAVLAAARQSLTWRDVDAELAELLADSDALVGSGARSVTLDARLLTFAAGDLVVELEVAGTGRRRRLVGQLVPGTAAEVRVRNGDDVQRLDADELGRFACDVQAGPLSLVVRVPGRQPVVTAWTAV